MSEANPPPTPPSTSGVDASLPPTGSVAASLYPNGGGQGGAAIEPVAPAGETLSAPAGADTLVGGAGADSLTGADTGTGTEAGTEGNDTIAGTEGADSLTAESYTLALPDGFVADDALMTQARTTFAELGIPVESAQPLIDLYVSAAQAANERATADYQAQQTAWLGEVNAMPEFQGEARATSLQAIGRMLDEYGTPEVTTALDAYGMGNNPVVVKMFLKLASALSEGQPTGQGRPAPTGGDGRPVNAGRRTIGQRLYPDTQTK